MRIIYGHSPCVPIRYHLHFGGNALDRNTLLSEGNMAIFCERLKSVSGDFDAVLYADCLSLQRTQHSGATPTRSKVSVHTYISYSPSIRQK